MIINDYLQSSSSLNIMSRQLLSPFTLIISYHYVMPSTTIDSHYCQLPSSLSTPSLPNIILIRLMRFFLDCNKTCFLVSCALLHQCLDYSKELSYARIGTSSKMFQVKRMFQHHIETRTISFLSCIIQRK